MLLLLFFVVFVSCVVCYQKLPLSSCFGKSTFFLFVCFFCRLLSSLLLHLTLVLFVFLFVLFCFAPQIRFGFTVSPQVVACSQIMWGDFFFFFVPQKSGFLTPQKSRLYALFLPSSQFCAFLFFITSSHHLLPNSPHSHIFKFYFFSIHFYSCFFVYFFIRVFNLI